MTQESNVEDDSVVFRSTEPFTWESDVGITVKTSGDFMSVSYFKEFDDLIELVEQVQKIAGKRPLFEMDEDTANTKPQY